MRILILFVLLISFVEVSAKSKYKYELAIAAIFQNECPYIKEWIEYHKLIGVEHFYLFNNLSTDNYLTVLTPYINSGQVDLIDWPYDAGPDVNRWGQIQLTAYNKAVPLARGKAKWLAVIDLDEFLLPKQTNDLRVFLKDYEEYGGVCINWQMFGTSNVESIPPNKLMIEMLLMKAPIHFGSNIHVKSIIRPERVTQNLGPHHFEYQKGYFQVTADKTSFSGPYSPFVSVNKICINHYWSRDKHYFHTVKVAHRMRYEGDANKIIQAEKQMNDVKDTEILRFAPILRLMMGL